MQDWKIMATFATLMTAALAGCVTDPAARTQEYHAFGENGYFAFGFAYDGRGVQQVTGPVYIDVNPRDNMGLVVAPIQIGDDRLEIRFDEFNGTQPFHGGGITLNLLEHGDSGVGDTSIPTVFLAAAGWGQARILKNGEALPDPVSGRTNWTAHFMVIDNGVRDDNTQAIYKSDGQTPYDPNDPGDGLSVDGDREIHLVLRGALPPGGTHEETQTIRNSAKINTLEYVATHSIDVALPEREVTLRISVSSDAVVGPTAELIFAARSPSNQLVGSQTVNAGQTGTITFTPTEIGDYTLRVSGRALQADYRVDAVASMGQVVFNFWWEDVVFGTTAAERGQALNVTTMS